MLRRYPDIGLAALVVASLVTSLACGAVAVVQQEGSWPLLCQTVAKGGTVGLCAGQTTFLACWLALCADRLLRWAWVLLILMLQSYAAFAGFSLMRTPLRGEDLAALVGMGVFFFAVYAVAVPMRWLFGWRIVSLDWDDAPAERAYRISLRQLFFWLFAIALPFSVWRLLMPAERNGAVVLASFVVSPFALAVALPCLRAALSRANVGRRLLTSLLFLFAVSTVVSVLVVGLQIPQMTASGAVRPLFFSLVILAVVSLIGSLGTSLFLVSVGASWWLRLCGFRITTAREVQQSKRAGPQLAPDTRLLTADL